ncbi:MAG: rhomboid family intramembrane serine protease [Chitinophagaceae bacterium]|nr:rhomboid family intramembrane serine protease [Chitinophagaceae bacterium]
MARYDFQVEKVLVYKDYKRLFTSAFLHANWLHLIFNMIALFYFGMQLGAILGTLGFLLTFILGILGGVLLALYIQRYNSGYSAIGPSAGINAVMLACIALVPGMRISLFFIPIPGWIIGLAYMLISIYGIRSRREGISHEAHLGGGITGIIIAVLLQPSALQNNLWVILLMLIPSLSFIFLIVRYPHFLILGTLKPRTNHTVEDRANIERKITEAQVDEILEKINKKGISSLTKKEKEALEKYSRP